MLAIATFGLVQGIVGITKKQKLGWLGAFINICLVLFMIVMLVTPGDGWIT